MQNKLISAVVVAIAVWPAATLAESPSDSLTRIEAETLILKARERQLDVQAKIIARQNEIAAKQAETDRLAQVAVVGHPVIRSVEGFGTSMFATLQLENGSVVDVGVGDYLSNGMKVVSIRPNEVIAETSKKERVRLATIGQSPVLFNPSFPRPAIMLPPPLPAGIPRGVAR